MREDPLFEVLRQEKWQIVQHLVQHGCVTIDDMVRVALATRMEIPMRGMYMYCFFIMYENTPHCIPEFLLQQGDTLDRQGSQK